MNQKKWIFFTSILFILNLSLAQNYQAEMLKISSKIQESESYHIAGKISIYSDQKGGKLLRQFDADVHRNKSGFRSKIDDTEVISNQNMIITIDHEEYYMQIENQEKMDRKDEQLMMEIQQLSNQDTTFVSSVLLTTNQNVNTYRLVLKGDIKMVEISIDNLNLSIKKIAYYYDEEKFPVGNFIVINYSVFEYDLAVNESLLSGSDVIRKSGSQITPIGKCEKYHLVNLYQD